MLLECMYTYIYVDATGANLCTCALRWRLVQKLTFTIFMCRIFCAKTRFAPPLYLCGAAIDIISMGIVFLRV